MGINNFSKFNYSTIIALVLLVSQYTAEGRGPIIWQEEFDTLNTSRWKYMITGWRGGNSEFQYYADYPENRLNTVKKFLIFSANQNFKAK